MKYFKPIYIMALLTGGLVMADSSEAALFTVNNTWMLVSTILVFIMHLGFATLESGLTRAKNTVNILFKNVSIIAIGLLTYAICGFNLMYPGEFSLGGVFGFAGWGISVPQGAAGLVEYADGAYTYFTDFIFPGHVCRNGCNHCFRCCGRESEVGEFFLFSLLCMWLSFIPLPVPGSGVQVGWIK